MYFFDRTNKRNSSVVSSTAAFFCVILLIPPRVETKICESIDVRNFVSNFEKLRNCTEIIGNLMIVLLKNTESESDYDPYVFPELQKVTGFVMLYDLEHFTSLGKLFPNLRLIRGLTLIHNYALVIYHVPRMREIGTSKLSYIARGYIKIGETPNLCYQDTINWKKIGPDSFAHYKKYRSDCPPCPERCNGYCWNQDECQVFTDDCHEECLGCIQPGSNAHCEVCKNYESDGLCVAECPSDKFALYEVGQCITKDQCLSRTNKSESWFVYDGECLNQCPEGTNYNDENNSCKPCGDKCLKWCPKAVLTTQIAIENMKGCTHINGSLSITDLKHKEEKITYEFLLRYLRSIRYIKDYLLIARNEILEDFNFLPNLADIRGENLNGNKALFVFGNRNLKKLWDLNNKRFSLKIRHGNIGFHDNEKLCLTEIEQFALRNNITYSETDVSQYSNGFDCNIVIDTQLQVNITDVSSNNVTLVWERKYGEQELYYIVHYSDSEVKEEMSQDMCLAKNSGAETLTTAHNFAQLVKLKPYTTYNYYISTYLNTMKGKEKTNYRSFSTLPDDPDAVPYFFATPMSHDSIKLEWAEPRNLNGKLSKYKINVYREEDDPAFVKKRNYCSYSFTPLGSQIDKSVDEPLPGSPKAAAVHNETLITNECTTPSEEINIRLQSNHWLFLCDINSQSKFGVDYCRKYYYDNEHFDINRSQIKRSQITDQDDPKRKVRESFFSIKQFPPVTSYTLEKLKQFTMYVFYIVVCNENHHGRQLCSPVLQNFTRTLKNPEADNIQDFSVQLVNSYDIVMTWNEPQNPNGFILAYNVIYRRESEGSKNAKNQTECILPENFRQNRKFVLRNLIPGRYVMMVQAVSLAGPGKLSVIPIKIDDAEINPWWIVLIGIFFVGVLMAIAIIIFLRMKSKNFLENLQLIPHINPDYTALGYQADEWEIERDDIELYNIMGQGTFGTVYLGQWKSKNMACAVKTVKEEASYQEKVRFLEEASTMKGCVNGAHVVKLFGVVTKSQPLLVIMELMERGDLKRYLLRVGESSQTITSNEIYRMAIEIADGLAYLTSRKFVHRDLAARNCMVSQDRTVKIGDFGMTRDVYQSDYYKKGSGTTLLPVRWMAPESLADGVYTCDSDIWSYGIVLWEIVTCASQPYQGLIGEEIIQFVISKGTLRRPLECPNMLWEIMRKCWDWYPTRRPTSLEIVEILQDHVGPDFKSLSFYHSTSGQEYLMSHGSVRPNHPPAMSMVNYRHQDNHNHTTENHPLNIEEEQEEDENQIELQDPGYVLQSSPNDQRGMYR